jgi:hypothetical protein
MMIFSYKKIMFFFIIIKRTTFIFCTEPPKTSRCPWIVLTIRVVEGSLPSFPFLFLFLLMFLCYLWLLFSKMKIIFLICLACWYDDIFLFICFLNDYVRVCLTLLYAVLFSTIQFLWHVLFWLLWYTCDNWMRTVLNVLILWYTIICHTNYFEALNRW